ncbi:hypothetical protein LTR97_002188 [Elasticomyces elasticus]|uniref:Uncharacterized protein n=1 Tax=Elasticomyces elasticus TaxID=574655 RepID=A0AAN7VV30_9PEZI|nr:hypothetical protein LTR97_002188 [Elasticomyces elasticus]
MPSKFYAASGVAYTTPTAFFEPNQRKPDVLHPALRPRASSQRVRKTSSNEPTVKDRETCEAVHDMLRRHRQFKVYNRASPAKSNDESQLEIQSAPRGSFSSAKPVKPIPSGSGKYPPRVESLQSSPPSKPIPVREPTPPETCKDFRDMPTTLPLPPTEKDGARCNKYMMIRPQQPSSFTRFVSEVRFNIAIVGMRSRRQMPRSPEGREYHNRW